MSADKVQWQAGSKNWLTYRQMLCPAHLLSHDLPAGLPDLSARLEKRIHDSRVGKYRVQVATTSADLSTLIIDPVTLRQRLMEDP